MKKFNLEAQDDIGWSALKGSDIEGQETGPRGDLLSERPDDLSVYDVWWVRQRPILLVVFFAIVASLVMLPFVFRESNDSVSQFIIVTLSAYLGGFILLMIGRWVWYVPIYALKVYENGVLVEDSAGLQYYTPWGYFSRAHDKKNRMGRNLVLLGPMGLVLVHGQMPGYDEWVIDVQTKVHTSEPPSDDPHAPRGKKRDLSSKIVGWIMLYVMASSLVVLSIYFGWYYDGGSIDWQAITLGYLYISLIFIPVFGNWLLKYPRVRYYGHSAVRYAVVIVVALVFAYTAFTVGYLAYESEPVSHDLHPIRIPDPGHSSIPPGTYQDTELVADGPVSVHDGEELVLINTSLMFDPAPGINGGLWVGEGGNLILRNSTVSSTDPFVGFHIKIYGSATVEDSEILGTSTNRHKWNDVTWEWEVEYPLEIASDDVVFSRTRIADTLGTGMFLNRCNILIQDCTFFRTEESGIVAWDSESVIMNTTFHGCFYGLNLWGSKVTVTGSTFRSCEMGVNMRSASPTITNSTFFQCRDYAIFYLASSPSLENNTFSKNGWDIYEASDDYYDYTLFTDAMIVYMAPVMVLGFAVVEGGAGWIGKWHKGD